MNICFCGTQAGYPHDPTCPYPMYRGDQQGWQRQRAIVIALADWRRRYRAQIAGGVYRNLEVHPVRDLMWNDDENGPYTLGAASDEPTMCEEPAMCEVCERDDAHFWSVYGHLVDGGLECFEDFPTEAEADAFAASLVADFPQLADEPLPA